MKKYVKITALCLALTCLLGISAFAEDGVVKKGIGSICVNKNLEDEELIGIVCEDGDVISGTIDGVDVLDAEKFTLSYMGAAKGAQYMVFLLSGASGAPSESNIAYIDQKAAGDTGVEFTIYPNELKKGDYRIILTCASDDKVGINNPVATFKYYQAYKLGDVDDSGSITAFDASLILQYCVADPADKAGIIPADLQIAADVDVSGGITAYDASIILQYCVADEADKPGIIPD